MRQNYGGVKGAEPFLLPRWGNFLGVSCYCCLTCVLGKLRCVRNNSVSLCTVYTVYQQKATSVHFTRCLLVFVQLEQDLVTKSGMIPEWVGLSQVCPLVTCFTFLSFMNRIFANLKLSSLLFCRWYDSVGIVRPWPPAFTGSVSFLWL